MLFLGGGVVQTYDLIVINKWGGRGYCKICLVTGSTLASSMITLLIVSYASTRSPSVVEVKFNAPVVCHWTVITDDSTPPLSLRIRRFDDLTPGGGTQHGL